MIPNLDELKNSLTQLKGLAEKYQGLVSSTLESVKHTEQGKKLYEEKEKVFKAIMNGEVETKEALDEMLLTIKEIANADTSRHDK